MGLSITHGCFEGPYSTFNEFRYSLGYLIGINLDEYEEYNNEGTKSLSEVEHPIKPLLTHSDCEGILMVWESESIA